MQNASGISRKYRPVLFDSRSLQYKSPFGAVSTRQKVFILFPVSKDLNSDRVKLIVRRNAHSLEYKLTYMGENYGYDNYFVNFTIDREGTYFYRFEVESGDKTYYVGRDDEGKAIIGDWLPEWQLSVYQSTYETPDYIKGGVIYQIFCDRFFHSGDKVVPKYGVLKEWHEDVTVVDPDGVFRANDFYGGNFKGITEKLDYLSDLGVTAIYLTPIFKSHSNHRYDTADYSKIDDLLGTEEDFENFVKSAESKGIAVILDGVFNHTGADSVYFNKLGRFPEVGAYQSEDSKYHDWFTFYDFPDNYACWWGITVVPTVARDAVGYREMIAGSDGIIKKWTEKGVRGWRLDVVDELTSSFVEKIRKAVKTVDKNGLVIGEVWEDASTKQSYGEERQYFYGRQLDGVMNYVYKDAIIKYMFDNDSKSFVNTIYNIMENYPKHSLDTCFTLLDSHDTVRAINVFSEARVDGDKQRRRDYRLTDSEYNRGKKRLILASAIQFFLPGVPCVYYGDEIGMQGFEDPINRRPFTWDNIDDEILSHYKYLGKLRKNYREDFYERAVLGTKGDSVIIKRGKLTLTVNPKSCDFTIEEE